MPLPAVHVKVALDPARVLPGAGLVIVEAAGATGARQLAPVVLLPLMRNVTEALHPAVITTGVDMATLAMGVVPEYSGAWNEAPVRSSENGPTPEPPVKLRSIASAFSV